MSKEMSSFHVRVDKDFYDILTKKAKERNIKIGRYIRMLIERGLVIDHQYHNENSAFSNVGINDTALLQIISQLCAETTMVLRYVYRNNFNNDEEFKDMANKIYNQSQQLLEMMKSTYEKN